MRYIVATAGYICDVVFSLAPVYIFFVTRIETRVRFVFTEELLLAGEVPSKKG